MTHSCRRSISRGIWLTAVVVLVVLIAAPRALAQAPVDIQSGGPLTDIWIGENLSCQVAHSGESAYEFYSPGNTSGNCGMSLSVPSDGSAQLYGFLGTAWTPVSQSALTGSGTASDPFRVTTVVQAASTGLTLTQVDSYVAGNEYYRTDLTVTNSSPSTTWSGLKLYRAADCYLQGSDSGFGFVDSSNGAVACAQNANNQPQALIEEFAPLTPGSHYVESYYGTVYNDVQSQADLPDTCDCNGSPSNPGSPEDNGMGINWGIASLAPGQSANFSLLSNFSASGATSFPITASGGNTLSGSAGSPVSGTVASFSDPDSSDSAGDFTATIDWGDSSSSSGSISGGAGNFNVAGDHTYNRAGSYTITVTITRTGNSPTSAVATDSAVITSASSPPVSGSPSVTAGAATGFTGSVNPGGLPTTASFQYGLDPKYTGGGPVVYTQSTAPQLLAADFSDHLVSASVAGLIPNAVYHVRLVATNSAGTTFGPDVSFATPKAPPPSAPTIGQTFNVAPVSGVVLIKVGGQLVPLTQLKQIPQNAVIDALDGRLQIVTAGVSPPGAHDAAARGKKGKARTQTGTFGGAVFRLAQATRGVNRGLVTLSLVEGAIKGAPTYATCKAPKLSRATAAAVSKRTLQLLRANARGRFSTRGRYGAATVRGTSWTIADRCDGTLTHDITHSVVVTDFVRHKTVVLHAGQTYLAPAPRKQ